MNESVLKSQLLGVLILLNLLSHAQITITADNVPSAGTNFIKGINDYPSGIDPGSPGPGKTWDFSMLMPDNTIGYSYVDPVATLYPEYFPESNLALHTSDTAYSYLYYDQEVYLMQGLVIEYEGNVYAFDYTPDMTLFNFPCTFGDELSQSYYFEWNYTDNEDSIKFKNYVTRDLEVDAFGTVLLPTGPYDALRAKVVQLNKDSIWAQVLGNWTLISVTVSASNYYDWYTNDTEVDIALVSFKYDESWSTLESAEYFRDSYVGLDEGSRIAGLEIYPNPTAGDLFIKSDNLQGFALEIFNNAGQSVFTQAINSDDGKVDIGKLSSGFFSAKYMMKI
jgi:hypothetical protein